MRDRSVEPSPAGRLREQLAAMTPEQRQLQRLEWRWQRALPKWTRATIRIQAVFRGYNYRRRNGTAKHVVASARHASEINQQAIIAFYNNRHNDVVNYLSACRDGGIRPETRLIKAKSLYCTGDVTRCAEECGSMIHAHPQDTTEELRTQFVYLYALTFAKLEKWLDVVRLSEQLQSHATLGEDARALYQLGLWKIDSLSYYNRVHELEPCIGQTSDFSACACAVYQNWDKGMEYFDKAIEEHPLNPHLYCLRARMKFCLRAYDDARHDYEHALKLQPANQVATEGMLQLDYIPDKYPMVTAEDIEDRL